jgi:hypothetical protein
VYDLNLLMLEENQKYLLENEKSFFICGGDLSLENVVKELG